MSIAYLSELPTEVFTIILDYCSLGSIVGLSQTCKHFKEIISHIGNWNKYLNYIEQYNDIIKLLNDSKGKCGNVWTIKKCKGIKANIESVAAQSPFKYKLVFASSTNSHVIDINDKGDTISMISKQWQDTIFTSYNLKIRDDFNQGLNNSIQFENRKNIEKQFFKTKNEDLSFRTNELSMFNISSKDFKINKNKIHCIKTNSSINWKFLECSKYKFDHIKEDIKIDSFKKNHFFYSTSSSLSCYTYDIKTDKVFKIWKVQLLNVFKNVIEIADISFDKFSIFLLCQGRHRGVQWCSVLSKFDGSEIGYFRTPNDLTLRPDMSLFVSNHHIFCVSPQIICIQNKYEELLHMRDNIKFFRYKKEVENYHYHEQHFPFWKKDYEKNSPSYFDKDEIDDCLYKLLRDNCDDLTSGSSVTLRPGTLADTIGKGNNYIGFSSNDRYIMFHYFNNFAIIMDGDSQECSICELDTLTSNKLGEELLWAFDGEKVFLITSRDVLKRPPGHSNIIDQVSKFMAVGCAQPTDIISFNTINTKESQRIYPGHQFRQDDNFMFGLTSFTAHIN